MAHIWTGGVGAKLPAEQLNEVKQVLANLRPDSSVVLELPNDDGDLVWLRIPFDAAVKIVPWDCSEPGDSVPKKIPPLKIPAPPDRPGPPRLGPPR